MFFIRMKNKIIKNMFFNNTTQDGKKHLNMMC